MKFVKEEWDDDKRSGRDAQIYVMLLEEFYYENICKKNHRVPKVEHNSPI